MDQLHQNHLSTVLDERDHDFGPWPGQLHFAKLSVLFLHPLKFEIYQVTELSLHFTNTVI